MTAVAVLNVVGSYVDYFCGFAWLKIKGSERCGMLFALILLTLSMHVTNIIIKRQDYELKKRKK